MMALRDEAKMGLQRMDDMGQMGNSEEAIIPDGVPFGMDDLEIEDDGEPQEFNLGGVVQAPGTGIAGYTPPSMTTTGYTPPPVGTAVAPVVPGSQPQVSFTPATATTNIPTFGQFVGTGGGKYDELVTYVNDAGQIMQIPHVNGKPIYPVPEGFKKQTDAPGTAPDSTIVDTTTVAPQQPQGEGGDRQNYGGGTSLLTGEKIAGYSPEEIKSGVASAKDRYAITGNRGFDLLNVIPGGNFIKSLMPDSVSANVFGKDPTIPEDASVPPGIGMPVSAVQARDALQQSLGTKITGYVGFEKGDLDPNSGGFFDKNGIAVDPRTGDQSRNESGTMNYASFADFREAFSAGTKSGWRGGKVGATTYAGLSRTAKTNYDKFADIMGYTDHKTAKEPTQTEKALGYPSGVTQRDFGKETASEAAAREAANRAQAERQAAARAARDAKDRARENDEGGQDTGVGESDGGGYGSDAGTGGGGDMGVICLTEDMKVKRNGIIDFVTNVKVGDIIDNTVVTEVLHKHMREGYYKVNGELKITSDHPVLANGLWKRTEDLVLGDYINNVEVTSLEYVEQVTPTVYIGTADDRYDVYTEGKVYTVHGQYKNALKKAA